MQKLDFTENLQTITDKLKSMEIVQLFDTGFNTPQNPGRYDLINPLLFISKSNYDQIKGDEKYSKIFDSLNAQSIYTEANLSHLTVLLRQVNAIDIIKHQSAVLLFTFHKTLLTMLALAKDVLTTPEIQKGSTEILDDGILIFQIVIEGEGLETEKYIKIFTALEELINTISKVKSEQDQKQEIILLDSGSDTNVGIKSGVETTKSLFLIFKEIWEFATSYRHYKLKQKNNTLMESLTIRAEIKKKVEDRVITEDEGKEYLHMIKTRTDELIGMKVLPKVIVMENNQVENKKLIQQFEGLKLLTNGDDSDD
jgi:hypothetical protein